MHIYEDGELAAKVKVRKGKKGSAQGGGGNKGKSGVFGDIAAHSKVWGFGGDGGGSESSFPTAGGGLCAHEYQNKRPGLF